MDSAARAILALVSSIVALAIISVVLSTKANTAGVIKAASGGLSTLITSATAPITGGAVSSSGNSALNTFNSVAPVVSNLLNI